jgi:hypothetical protein
MASTGHAAAKGRLQPTGRPVIATTFRPAALRSPRARRASGVMAPSVVSVSSMSVKTPTSWARSAAGQVASGRRRSGASACRADRGLLACEAASAPSRPVPNTRYFAAAKLTHMPAMLPNTTPSAGAHGVERPRSVST